MLNVYDRVILSMGVKQNSSYMVTDVSLEYKIVNHPDLASNIALEYKNTVLLYDRVLTHRQIPLNKLDMTWNWSFDTPCKSLKRVFVLFEAEQSFTQDTRKCYNPKMQKVSVIVKVCPISYMLKDLQLIE